MQRRTISTLFVLGLVLGAAFAAAAGDDDPIARGRYLAKIGGCNDCHTPNYPQTGGKVPEAQWLTGDAIGWRGPWGTTYPVNLRLLVNRLSEQEWVHMARTLKSRPPMPWYELNEMTATDLRALYRFIRYLGPAGKPAPAYVPPGQEPRTPFIPFTPVQP